METVNIADAKARLSELADRAAAGEEIQLTKRGKPMAKIVPIESVRKPIDIGALRSHLERLRAKGTPVTESSVTQMRDEYRY